MTDLKACCRLPNPLGSDECGGEVLEVQLQDMDFIVAA